MAVTVTRAGGGRRGSEVSREGVGLGAGQRLASSRSVARLRALISRVIRRVVWETRGVEAFGLGFGRGWLRALGPSGSLRAGMTGSVGGCRMIGSRSPLELACRECPDDQRQVASVGQRRSARPDRNCRSPR